MLSDDDCKLCDDVTSLAELTEAVNSLSLGKSPSLDGFTVEFYRKFWHLLGPLLLRVALESFTDGTLPDSMKGNATRLIFKKRGDLREILRIGAPSVCSTWIIRLFLKYSLLACPAF